MLYLLTLNLIHVMLAMFIVLGREAVKGFKTA
jgi:hypothetical protein